MCCLTCAVAQGSASSVRWAAEAALSQGNISHLAQPPVMQHQNRARLETQVELTAAGVDGVCGMWGGQFDATPVPPRLLDMADFCKEAEQYGAVVFPLLRGAYPAQVVQLLQDFGAAYSGSGPVAVLNCSDKVAAIQAVGQAAERVEGIITPPSQVRLSWQTSVFFPTHADFECTWIHFLFDIMFVLQVECMHDIPCA